MNVETFRSELITFLDSSGVSQKALADRAGIRQSQISEWRKGNIKRFGKNPKKVIEAIKNYRNSDALPIPEEVQTALRAFCADDPSRFDVVIDIINSIQSLTSSTQHLAE